MPAQSILAHGLTLGVFLLPDFRPVLDSERTFGLLDIASLWIGLVVSLTTYFLAGSMVADMGMSWWQALLTIVASNVITLVPLVLSAHPGTKYGIPFPVLARASFGIRGANLPALMRALVACGWFGLNTWLAASAIHALLAALVAGGAIVTSQIAWLGISATELACFVGFWGLQVAIITKGMESVRFVEKYAAPILIALSAALLIWARRAAGGFGPMLSAKSQFATGMAKEGQFWQAFLPAVTANIGYWATLSLNISDFTRYAKSQRAQVLGQALGLPLFMLLFTFVGLAVTSATVTIFGNMISDPIALASQLPGLAPKCLALLGLVLATITTNLAANAVPAANALVNLNPRVFSFTKSAVAMAIVALITRPWLLISSSKGFIFTWLIGYSVLLGPVGGILLADYYVVKRRQLDVNGLYSADSAGPYWYKGGWNRAAVLALLGGIAPTLPGLLQEVGLLQNIASWLRLLYSASWFVGTLTGSAMYVLLTRRTPSSSISVVQAS
eukprot:jgi/Astpho2/7041/e_gw1.00107.50.1_t